MRNLSTILVISVAALVVAGTASARPAFQTKQSGDQEVPAVDTRARGNLMIKVNKRETEAKFRLTVRKAEAVTQAHLHCGAAGLNGPIVSFLWGMVPGGFDVRGKLAQFTLTDVNIEAVGADCMPSIERAIDDIADLADAMEDGLIYVNVHTVANPAGEIRGQL